MLRGFSIRKTPAVPLGDANRRALSDHAFRARWRLDIQPDLAGHPCPAQPAISPGVLGEILLVVILGVVERSGGSDFRRDWAIARFLESRLIGVATLLGGLALFIAIGVDRRAILCAGVVSL